VRTQSFALADTAFGAPWYARELRLDGPSGPGGRGGRYRRLDYLEIIAVVDGTGRLVSYRAAGIATELRLRPGHLILLRPVDEPLLEATEDGMTILFVAFLYDDWRTFANFVGIDPGWLTAPDPPVAHVDPGDPGALRPFRTALGRFLDEPAPIDLLEFWLAIVPLLLPTRSRDHDRGGMPTWLANALDEMHLEDNLRAGVPRLQELCHVSGPYLSVTTRRHLGKTPTTVVTEYRLRHASRLLATTGEDIGLIAQRCGFSHLSYFSNSFRRAFHVSPREYRARSRSGFSYGGERASAED
jgi:AraC family cel operon transcriptional repressor